VGVGERERLAESLLRAERAYRAAQRAVSADRGSDTARRAYGASLAALVALEREAERVLCRSDGR